MKCVKLKAHLKRYLQLSLMPEKCLYPSLGDLWNDQLQVVLWND